MPIIFDDGIQALGRALDYLRVDSCYQGADDINGFATILAEIMPFVARLSFYYFETLTANYIVMQSFSEGLERTHNLASLEIIASGLDDHSMAC